MCADMRVDMCVGRCALDMATQGRATGEHRNTNLYTHVQFTAAAFDPFIPGSNHASQLCMAHRTVLCLGRQFFIRSLYGRNLDMYMLCPDASVQVSKALYAW